MSESPFATVNAILSEPSNACDMLRIIAGEAPLKAIDKEVLRDAAGQLELAYRQLVSMHFQIIEEQQHALALLERVNEGEKTIKELRSQLRRQEMAPNHWAIEGHIQLERWP